MTQDAKSANSEQDFTRGLTHSAGDGGCWGTYVQKMKDLEAVKTAAEKVYESRWHARDCPTQDDNGDCSCGILDLYIALRPFRSTT